MIALSAIRVKTQAAMIMIPCVFLSFVMGWFTIRYLFAIWVAACGESRAKLIV